MHHIVCKDEKAWIDSALTWVNTAIKPGQRLFVPAGGTPKALYQQFRNHPFELLKTLTFVQIDDICTGPEKGLFKNFLCEELSPFLKQIEFIDKADQTADAALLGVGVNGHVAFHEPEFAKNFASGCVKLSDKTLNYLNLKEPTWGITYGVASFVRCKQILVLAMGKHKQDILRKALAEKNLPISWILEHPAATLITDFPL